MDCDRAERIAETEMLAPGPAKLQMQGTQMCRRPHCRLRIVEPMQEGPNHDHVDKVNVLKHTGDQSPGIL